MGGEPDEERKRDDRREWLGEPIEHGGGYRPSRRGDWVPDAGCCLVEAIASSALVLSVGLSVYALLP